MSEIEVRQSPVSRTLVPRPLQELGVVMAVEEDTGREIIMFPPQTRQHLNVLDPVSSFAQARPDWSPAIRVVQLDPDPENGPHFYKQAGNKLAPTKQALELLGKAANVLYTKTRRMPKDDLAEGERLGYIATIGIRRPDGSVEELERSKTFVEEAELEEIKDAVTRGGRFGAAESAQWSAEVRKRWLAELKNSSAKTETKAVLRAIRSALQIPHTFAPARASLPFVVVGFNFTPDQSDPEVRRILTQAGVNAGAQIYGDTVPSPRSDLELEAGAVTPVDPVDVPTDTTPTATGGGTGPPSDASGDVTDGQQATGERPSSPVAPGTDDEPEPSLMQSFGSMVPEKAIDEAGAAEVPRGDAKGTPLAEIAAQGDEGEKYLAWAIRRAPTYWSESFRASLDLYVQHRLPDVWKAYIAEREAA